MLKAEGENEVAGDKIGQAASLVRVLSGLGLSWVGWGALCETKDKANGVSAGGRIMFSCGFG